MPVDFSRRRDDEKALPVLLLSSKTSFLDQLRARLEPLKWEIFEARSGAEALEVLHDKGTIEVLLLDPVLPDLLPTEFCGMVRDRYPDIEILTMNIKFTPPL